MGLALIYRRTVLIVQADWLSLITCLLLFVKLNEWLYVNIIILPGPGHTKINNAVCDSRDTLDQ